MNISTKLVLNLGILGALAGAGKFTYSVISKNNDAKQALIEKETKDQLENEILFFSQAQDSIFAENSENYQNLANNQILEFCKKNNTDKIQFYYGGMEHNGLVKTNTYFNGKGSYIENLKVTDAYDRLCTVANKIFAQWWISTPKSQKEMFGHIIQCVSCDFITIDADGKLVADKEIINMLYFCDNPYMNDVMNETFCRMKGNGKSMARGLEKQKQIFAKYYFAYKKLESGEEKNNQQLIDKNQIFADSITNVIQKNIEMEQNTKENNIKLFKDSIYRANPKIFKPATDMAINRR